MASHADAAHAWLNYIMRGDVFWLTLIDYTYINPNKAALEFAKANHTDVLVLMSIPRSPIRLPRQSPMGTSFRMSVTRPH